MTGKRRRRMTEERRRVLDFIVAFDKREGRGPSYSEMEKAADVARSVLFGHVRELIAAGYLTKDEETRQVLVVRANPADPAELRECLTRLKTECELEGLGARAGFDCWLSWANRLLETDPARSVEEVAGATP